MNPVGVTKRAAGISDGFFVLLCALFRGNVKKRGQQQNLVVKICAKICNFGDMKQWQVLKTGQCKKQVEVLKTILNDIFRLIV